MKGSFGRIANEHHTKPSAFFGLSGKRGKTHVFVVSAAFLESTLLRRAGFRHAFFERRGGVSRGLYESLNFSVTVGDEAENVQRNFALAAETLGVHDHRIFFLSQVHGALARVLVGDETLETVRNVEGDALSSRNPDLACSVRTADCIPLLVADRRSGAVTAIHAGWRGIVRGIVEAGIASVRELAGANAELVVAIGPHIREGAFEVSDDVARELEAASPVPGVVNRGAAKPHVSLVRIVRGKLGALGISADAIDDVGGCTHGDTERFFSFRRDGKRSGRLLSAVVPRPAE
jgi:YfiH family protein